MSSRPFPLAQQIPLAETFSDMSQTFRSYVLSGFRIFSELSPQTKEVVTQQIFEKLNNRETDIDEFSRATGVAEDDAGPLISMATLLLAIVSARTDSPTEIAGGLRSAKLIDERSLQPASALVEYLVGKRSEIQRSMRLSAVADQILPSFRGFDTSIEIRLGFKETEIEVAVPVAVARLHTDKDGEEVYFQMTSSDVDSLIRNLTEISSKLERAEVWMKAR